MLNNRSHQCLVLERPWKTPENHCSFEIEFPFGSLRARCFLRWIMLVSPLLVRPPPSLQKLLSHVASLGSCVPWCSMHFKNGQESVMSRNFLVSVACQHWRCGCARSWQGNGLPQMSQHIQHLGVTTVQGLFHWWVLIIDSWFGNPATFLSKLALGIKVKDAVDHYPPWLGGFLALLEKQSQSMVRCVGYRCSVFVGTGGREQRGPRCLVLKQKVDPGWWHLFRFRNRYPLIWIFP